MIKLAPNPFGINQSHYMNPLGVLILWSSLNSQFCFLIFRSPTRSIQVLKLKSTCVCISDFFFESAEE